jgi:hypothetical protein
MESIDLPYSFFNKKDFERLADIHDTSCVSIYISTKRAGQEVLEGQFQLKNCITQVTAELEQLDYKKAEIENFLKPVDLLLDDASFWRNQSDGLAIFLSKEGMWHYTLPLAFKKYAYVSNHFYLLPVIPFFNGDGKYFMLSLSQGRIRFFEGNRHSITEVRVDDLSPPSMKDAVNHEHKQKNLQFRSGQGSNQDAIFNGHSDGIDDNNKEIERLFHLVDDGLMKLIGNEDCPLILACQDQYYPVYKKITNYAYLFNDFINTNPDQEDALLLHEKAWLLIKDFFQGDQKNKVIEYENLQHTTKASSELEQIIRAAVDGRVETLFIQTPKEIHGLYDEENRSVIIDETKSISNASLINLTAVKSINQGAKVYLLNSEEMPVKRTVMNAIYRY